MIEFDRVSLHYPGGQGGLSDVSFRLARGELAVLSGHSGAGKTSLLKLIAAIERPTAGRVTVGGEDVGALPRQAGNAGGAGRPRTRRLWSGIFSSHLMNTNYAHQVFSVRADRDVLHG